MLGTWLICLVLGLLFLGYVVERAFRYAEKNPLPALLGGAELLELFRDQRAAKNEALVINNEEPVLGASNKIIGSGTADV
jgi:hypothetical protein